MKLFMAKCFFLICIAFLGVLGGMQIANNGMKEMKGYEDPQLTEVVALKNTEDGKAEAEVLGQKVDIAAKEKELQEIKSFNIFSRAGEGFTTTIEKTLEVTVEPVITKMQQIVSGSK